MTMTVPPKLKTPLTSPSKMLRACAPGENGYIRKTSELVSDKSLIKTLGEYNAKLMKAIHSDNAKALTKAFKDIAKSSK